MRALILAGGKGTRLRPLTHIFNKNLLPVGGVPMIDYPLRKVAEAGIKEVCIVTGAEQIGDVVEYCKSGGEWGLDITYRVQEEALGIAHGIGLAENFARNDDLLVILGDNLFDSSLVDIVKYHDSRITHNAFVLVKKVDDPCRFGVVEYGPNGQIVGIHEKPKVAPSDDAVIGVYCYPPDVFEIIRNLSPSARGEYEVTDINNVYLKANKLKCHRIEGFWIDAGTHEAYETACKWAWSNKDAKSISGIQD